MLQKRFKGRKNKLEGRTLAMSAIWVAKLYFLSACGLPTTRDCEVNILPTYLTRGENQSEPVV